MTHTQAPTNSAPLLESLCKKLKKHPKRIVFPDGQDPRVLAVAAEMVKRGIGIPILLGDKTKITQLAESHSTNMQFISVVDPAHSGELELFRSRLEKMARYQQKKLINSADFIIQPHNFAAMMVQYGHADAIVSGNQSSAARVFRSAISMIKPQRGINKIFGVSVLEMSNLQHPGNRDILIMADCGVIPKPDVEDLATIAVETGKLAKHFLGVTPQVAMLSHSTYGSAGTKEARKMAAATAAAKALAKEQHLSLHIEGEIQADVALNPLATADKLAGKPCPKPADVLVFPNLDAGHISLKLLEHVAGARCYGQLIMGLDKPVAQVSRTVSIEQMLGTAILAGAEAIKFNNLHLDRDSE